MGSLVSYSCVPLLSKLIKDVKMEEDRSVFKSNKSQLKHRLFAQIMQLRRGELSLASKQQPREQRGTSAPDRPT